jgi:hypothetical protein
MVFEKAPTLLVSYLTFISPEAPGIIGSLVHDGVVHPQEALTLERISGAFPSFLKRKTQLPSAP